MDREKVIEGLEAMREFFGFGLPSQSPVFEAYQNILTNAISLLKEQPERKPAHWVFGNTMGHSWMKCSECCVSQSGQTGCWTYCPNCGAEMKGETEVEIN